MFAAARVGSLHAVNITVPTTGDHFELVYTLYRPAGEDTGPVKYLFPISLAHAGYIRRAAAGGSQDPMPILRRALAAALASDNSIPMSSIQFRGETPTQFQIVAAARAAEKPPAHKPGPLAGVRGKK